MIDHDAKPGHLHRCQICGSENLRLLIDLGHQPLCDSLLAPEQLNEPEVHYPLRLMQCAHCSLGQLDYVVAGTSVYRPDYPYRAGISWPVVAAHRTMAKRLVSSFGVGFCVDIGSNDGTLLAEFKALGCSVLGVEPTNIADLARTTGVPTVKDFFSEANAVGIVASHETRAHIITMTNVFAHMADLGEVMRGVSELLDLNGVLVIENHYLLDILEKNQFDSVYHEHIRTYTLHSLMTLFQQYGLQVFDVERVTRYGGNIRVYAGWEGTFPVSYRVADLLELELSSGICQPSVWSAFRQRVVIGKQKFLELIHKRDVAGCSAPGRSSTLLNFYGVRPDMMRWTGELAGSLKIGKLLPGCHIPVVDNKMIIDEQPEILVLLAWHYADEIENRLLREGVKSRLLAPLPEPVFRNAKLEVAA